MQNPSESKQPAFDTAPTDGAGYTAAWKDLHNRLRLWLFSLLIQFVIVVWGCRALAERFPGTHVPFLAYSLCLALALLAAYPLYTFPCPRCRLPFCFNNAAFHMLPGAPNCVHCALRRGATADPGDWNGVLSPAPPGTGLKSRRGRIGSTCFLYFFLLLWGWSWNGGRMRPHATRDFIRDMVTHNYEGAAGLMVYPNTEPPAAVVASLQARWQAYEAAHGPSNTPILLGQTFTNIHTWTNYYLLPFKNGGAGGAGIHFVRYHGINTVRALILYDTNADMPAPTSQVQD